MALVHVGSGGLCKLVRKVERSKHGDPQGVYSTTLRCNGAHLGVHQRGEPMDVGWILPRKMISLVVDVTLCSREAQPPHFSPWITSKFESIELRKQTFDALADLVALGTQRADFLFHLVDKGALFSELRFGLGGTLIGGAACQALALHKFDGPNDAFFER